MKDTPAPTAFFNKTYDEAVDLLVETRDYVADVAGNGRSWVPEVDGLKVSGELYRITARLTQVMAWLLIQRAIQNGELKPSDAAVSHHRLSGHNVCLNSDMHDNPKLPARLNDLLLRSHRLYIRVSRLDELAARNAV